MTVEGKPKGDLFSYSLGRFLYNEQMRLQERYVEFDVAALKDVVSTHTGRGNVVDFVKLSEGGFNRVFLLTLEDGFKTVVKIPYNFLVPKKYATASEVATLAFLRQKGIPVPDVYGWSSTPDNAVGAEYIVMEFVADMGLDTK
ncbi:phosphotransferase enzyme family protein [Histoplasma capsulatum var. duboisii H88]|nr:phosphotransferase enzyme family protein [Histoplasma capsulatum H143]EGC41762.1 phosphotransferase enzyme family protein [Histoplasma capsulatum var. duboisii H88]